MTTPVNVNAFFWRNHGRKALQDLAAAQPIQFGSSATPDDIATGSPSTSWNLGADMVSPLVFRGETPEQVTAPTQHSLSSAFTESAITAAGGTASLIESSSAITAVPSTSPASGALNVTTDQEDYAPGSSATFTVTGVNPGNSVAFQVVDSIAAPGVNGVVDLYPSFKVTDGGAGDADGLPNGTVIANWQVPADGSATGATLQLSATSNSQTATTTFSDAPNKIVTENQKAGTPQSVWAIHGSVNNLGDSQIEGFTTQISANAGQAVSFKINTASSGYTLDIYRLGYYGGNGATLVTSMHHSGADNQPEPIFNDATNTVDAGNWSVTDSWTIPSTAVSGVYIAKLTTDSGNFQNIIPFIVRNDGTASDITFQTSDETWQAYNPWGGYNLYQGPSGTNSDRAFAVSYNRPIDMNSTANLAGPADFLFGEELPAIFWLEQNGYNVSYISGIDAATNPGSLLNGKTYLDVGHDEYWTQSQFANVKAAADAGVNEAFLSGNQTYWDTSLSSSLDASHTANRTLVEYKDIWSGTQLDPNGTANGGAGLFRDPVYGPGTPENSLSGTIFTVDDIGTLDSISVPSSMSQLRIWRNTSIASGNGGTLTNLLGYEWDSDLDNGFRPAGLIDLSSTTRNVNSLLLDNGLTTGPGTATHSLTLYRDTTSGALIFGAGTVMWSWGLSNEHALYRGITAPVSSAVQQAMVNLFADMGISPQTLQASLVLAQASTDHTAPTAVITSPTGGTSFNQGQTVTITGTASDAGGRVAGIEVSIDGGTSWHPATGTTNWSYTWAASGPGTHVIEARATDDSVNLQTNPATLSINVTGTAAPSLFNASTTPAQVGLNDGSAIEVGVKFTSATAGQITALKFYRSPGDTSSDLVDLWSSAGTRLASVNFSNTTATGWQTVSLPTPVTINANTTYIASYHTNGTYVATENFFTNAVSTGNLTAPSSTSSGGNGVFSYGGTSTSGIFPTSTFGAANYFADVVFSPTGGGGTDNPPVAVNDSGLTATENTPLSIAGSTLLANDSDPDGDALTITGVSGGVNGTPSFNAQTNTVTFTPTNNFTGPASFTYAISDGRGGTANASVSLTVNPPGSTPSSLFTASNTPAQTNLNDGTPIEVGVKFTSSSAGQITALKFYRSPGDTSSDLVDLWTSTGTKLASATFSSTTATGWQTVTLATPVTISANTTYIASYHTTGAYVVTTNFFANALTSGNLTAPSSASSGGNGVFSYGGTSTAGIFPTSTFSSANYFADVVFTPSSSGTDRPPVAANDSGFTTTQNTVLSIAGSALLANDSDPDGDPLTITGVSGAVNGTATFNVQTNTVTFTPTTGYTGPASFTYAISDGRGGTASASVSLTVNPSGTDNPPVAVNDSGFTTTQNTALSIAGSTLLANDSDPDHDPLTITGVSGGVNGTATFNAQTNTVTFTPATGYTGPASFTYAISDGRGGTATATVALTVNAPSQTTVSLFTAANTPAQTNLNDGTPIEAGVKFTSSSAGQITALKFYRSSGDTSSDLVDLWSSSGTKLASATFTNTGASGWQTVTLATPVTISAGTTYIASYHTNGAYVATNNFFTNAISSGNLTAPSSASSGGNGVYSYGGTSTAGIFPTNTFSSANYFADVVFSPSSGGTENPPVAVNDSGFTATQNTALSIPGSALLANDSDPDGDPLTITGVSGAVNGTATFSAQTNTVTFTPANNYTGPASFSYAISDGRGGTASASVSLAVNAPSQTTVSLFSSNPTPSVVTVNDPNPVELGVKFQASTAGDITGLRFYKAPSNTGTHVADLWTSTGTLLATATFTNETASGWQQVNFTTPVTLTPGTTYIASYHTAGNYSADPNLFAKAVTNGPLTAPSSASSGGNGVYAYGTGDLFPTNTFNATSYAVDVLFRPQIAA